VLRNSIDGTLHRNGGAGASMAISMSGTVSGNLIQDNDFAAYDGPKLLPLSGFIDGGGNICGPLNPILSNFPCTGGSLSITSFSLFRRPR
jgi:hypothetical protein